MNAATTLTLASLRAADRVSPAIAAKLAMPLFRKVRPALPVRAGDRAVHEHAEPGIMAIRGREVRTYSWGRGAETVLVVHGWRGRAAQFGSIVRELRGEGFRVVAFDAPANGDSAGRRTDIRDYLAAIEQLQRRYGMFRAIIGHSFGSLAALTAVREGTATGGVVAIAGMADARYLVDAFAARVGLSRASADALARDFARRVLPDVAEPYARFDAVHHPLPEEVPLLVVHDRTDREVSALESQRLHDAHGARSRLVLTRGAGHSRVLAADTTLDAVTAFVTGGLTALDETGLAEQPVPAASA